MTKDDDLRAAVAALSAQILELQQRAAAMEIVLSVVVRSEHVRDRVLSSLPVMRDMLAERGYDPSFIALVESLALAVSLERPRPELRVVVDNEQGHDS